jgi:hypothetical protein
MTDFDKKHIMDIPLYIFSNIRLRYLMHTKLSKSYQSASVFTSHPDSRTYTNIFESGKNTIVAAA